MPSIAERSFHRHKNGLVAELGRFVEFLLDDGNATHPELEGAIGDLRSAIVVLEFEPGRMIIAPAGDIPAADLRIEALLHSTFPPAHAFHALYAAFRRPGLNDPERFPACRADAVRVVEGVVMRLCRIERMVDPDLESALDLACRSIASLRYHAASFVCTPDPAAPFADLRIERLLASTGLACRVLAATTPRCPATGPAAFRTVQRQALDLVARMRREAPALDEKLARLDLKVRRLAFDAATLVDGSDTRVDHFFALAFPPRHEFHALNARRLWREVRTERPQRSGAPGVS